MDWQEYFSDENSVCLLGGGIGELSPIHFARGNDFFGFEESKKVFFGGEGPDQNAYNVVKQTNLTEGERQYVLSVARGEGFYGLGWAPGEGAGSHNWGAVQGIGPAGSFTHIDHHADGTPYHTQFKWYNNDSEGMSDMARILLKPNVRAAIRSGSLRKAVFAQHSNKYFELDPEKYLSAVLRNYGTLTKNLGWKPLLSENGQRLWFQLLGGLAGSAAAFGGYRYLRNKHGA